MTGRAAWTLPIRRWLALALVVTFVAPALATGLAAAGWVWGAPRGDAAAAAQLLRDGAARWNDPAWQAATRAELAARNVDFLLLEDGREVYRSVADPLAKAGELAVDADGRLVQRLVLPAAGAQPGRTAYIFSSPAGGDAQRFWLVPLTGFTTLLLTLGGIAWVLGRAVNAPLAATGRAARQVAVGDLDVALPSSRVREVADVNHAFEAMSAELRLALRRQTELEQERRLFIGAVAHDLRTPLFALRGHLEGLATGVAATPEKAARYVAVAREKADALERLIADLFDFTRLEYLEQAPAREPLELGELLRRLVDEWRPEADAKGVGLAFDGPAGSCMVDGDRHLLTRAVANLLDNALRHTPPGGRVRVTCRPAAGGVVFRVVDSGPGIPERDLPRLFDPLFRGEGSRNRRTGGAGLGLTIARRILLAHGGELTAGNDPAGGAVFTGRLPGGGATIL